MTETPANKTTKRSKRPKKSAEQSVSAPRARASGKTRKKSAIPNNGKKLGAALLIFEGVFFTFAGLTLVIFLLGYCAGKFSGTSFFTNLLPFAAAVLLLALFAAVLVIGWRKVRPFLFSKSSFLPVTISFLCVIAAAYAISQDGYDDVFIHYRTLVGGKEEAERITLSHQVYAAYRRLDRNQLGKILDRAINYRADIEDAAKAYHLDANILHGLAVTESSYLPRESADGGVGLMQITKIPNEVTVKLNKQFAADKRQLTNPRYNIFAGAATLKYYLGEMKDDLFLGLLAYNIGPANGGLRSIMQQYGATDFITIQPYLQHLPRDYPIRVLSYALAFKIDEREGELLPYEKGDNARRIQKLGIPGLQNKDKTR